MCKKNLFLPFSPSAGIRFRHTLSRTRSTSLPPCADPTFCVANRFHLSLMVGVHVLQSMVTLAFVHSRSKMPLFAAVSLHRPTAAHASSHLVSGDSLQATRKRGVLDLRSP